jgi:hypothetical protein
MAFYIDVDDLDVYGKKIQRKFWWTRWTCPV